MIDNRTRRQIIIATADDLMSDFLYYDRKEDEDLPRGAIEEAIVANEIDVEEIVTMWRTALYKAVARAKP